MEEQQTEPVTTADHPLEVKPSNMKYGTIEGVEKPVSHIICGTHTFYTLPEGSNRPREAKSCYQPTIQIHNDRVL